MGSQRILVTGASGFIGSAVVRLLAGNKASVVGTARSRTEELARELGAPIAPADLLRDAPSLEGVGTIVHCATPNDIMSREADGGIPLAVMGTRSLLERAAKSGVKRFVYLSTLQVYGTELSGVVSEDTPVRCESLYGLNHYLGEEVCRYYSRTFGMDIVVLRPANVYGVPSVTTVDRWTLVPMCFVREALQTGSVTLKSSGRQQRNFISTDEVAELVAGLVADFPPGFTVVNGASDWYISIAEVAAMLQEVWQAEKGAALEVRILSDLPASANAFTIASRWAGRRLPPAASRQKMVEVMEGLLRLEHRH